MCALPTHIITESVLFFSLHCSGDFFLYSTLIERVLQHLGHGLIDFFTTRNDGRIHELRSVLGMAINGYDLSHEVLQAMRVGGYPLIGAAPVHRYFRLVSRLTTGMGF